MADKVRIPMPVRRLRGGDGADVSSFPIAALLIANP